MAGNVYTYAITVRGKTLAALAGRPLQDVKLKEIDDAARHVKVEATACEVDLFAWFEEHEEHVGEYPTGTLINWFRV